MNFITAISLWHDEAFSALLLRYSWSEMMHRIALDVHPPLYYILLRFWSTIAGQSLFALRGFSIFFGALTVWAGYLFVKAAFKNKKLALLAAIFIAINPFQIQYALEARMYTLGTFLALLSSYFLIKALESESQARMIKYWLWYGVAAAAALYTHYYLIFSIAAQVVYILFYLLRHRRIKILLGAAGAYIFALLLYVPWLKTFFMQLGQVQASYWIPPMDRWSVPGTIWKMFFGGPGAGHRSLLLASIAAALLVIYFIKKNHGQHKWNVLLALTVPFIAAIAISLKTDLYLDRYFAFASLFFVILVAGALNAIPRVIWRFLLIILFIGASLYAVLHNWRDFDAENRPGMAAAAATVNSAAKPNDKIYVASSFIYFTFKYYNTTGVRPLLISSSPLKDIPHFSGTALLADSDLVLNYKQATKNSAVWLLWTTGFGGQKPEIPKNWRLTEEKSYADTPGFKGEIFVDKYLVN